MSTVDWYKTHNAKTFRQKRHDFWIPWTNQFSILFPPDTAKQINLEMRRLMDAFDKYLRVQYQNGKYVDVDAVRMLTITPLSEVAANELCKNFVLEWWKAYEDELHALNIELENELSRPRKKPYTGLLSAPFLFPV